MHPNRHVVKRRPIFRPEWARNAVLQDAGQKAMIVAQYRLAKYEAEAKKRQGTRTDLDEPSEKSFGMLGEARELAAADFGVAARYIQDAKVVNEADRPLAGASGWRPSHALPGGDAGRDGA